MKFLLYLWPLVYAMHTDTKINFVPAPENSNSLKVSKSFFRIGDRVLTLEKYVAHSERSYVLVSLHSNEMVAINTSMQFAQQHGTTFYRLDNNNQKNVEADFLDEKVKFDPNHIFTSWGRRLNLKLNRCWNNMTNKKVQQFAHFLTNEFVLDKTIVSVHNSDNNASVNDYRFLGKNEKQAREIHQSRLMDPSDFFVTTDEKIYEQLQNRDFNVVLLQKGKVKDDGSLGVYCTKANKAFVNIEARASHPEEQQRMLLVIDSILP
ncbi:MAG: hypothetical protein ACJ75F_05305 [Flavisolibacter sp.]